MRQLNQNEINTVSGATLYLGDGVYMQVSSFGIPAHHFNAIEGYLQAQINADLCFQQSLASLYLDQYYCNMDGAVLFW